MIRGFVQVRSHPVPRKARVVAVQQSDTSQWVIDYKDVSVDAASDAARRMASRYGWPVTLTSEKK